jgi:hypothetical protein
MVFGLPLKQISERATEFIERERLGGPNAIIYAADLQYHRMCFLMQKYERKEAIYFASHPDIKHAERTYQNSLQGEAEGSSPTDVARGILKATTILQNVFTEELFD